MMSVSTLLRDLETTMTRGSGDQRAQILSRLTDLFAATASGMNEDQVGVFDVVIGRLARAIETQARADLSQRLSAVPNAPPGVVRQLALDEIAVARPVLVGSPRLTDQDLVAISAAKGRDHMLAITERPGLGEQITDFLILRGGRRVTHAVAANQTARFSRHGLGVLVMRAAQDDALQITLGTRRDIPDELVQQLVSVAKDSVRRRLSSSVEPAMAEALDGAIERSATALNAETKLHEDLGKFSAALAEIQRLHEQGVLDEARIADFGLKGETEYAICGIAILGRLGIEASEQIVLGADRDAILLVGRGLGWSWETTRALIGLRKGESKAAIDKARQNFRTMTPETAQRVLGFLRTRDAAP